MLLRGSECRIAGVSARAGSDGSVLAMTRSPVTISVPAPESAESCCA
jgi:hypothetical protein